ncbi:signal peptidase I [Streptomyces sp. NPDC028722]|uniref:signal peptidase I n=1 Tax=Streptomyces sp. NPDC028722 TaxID=3155016 RepID=UPI0033CEB234
MGLLPAGGSYLYGHGAYGTGSLPSRSMEPTYRRGDRIAWERVGGSEMRRGDVVTFSAAERYGNPGPLMQRVIGMGGDRVVCCTVVAGKERITVDGRPLKEPYVCGGDADGLHRSYDVRVPRGRLFLLGATGPTRWTRGSSPPTGTGRFRWPPCGGG